MHPITVFSPLALVLTGLTVADNQMKLAARSADDDYKCILKYETKGDYCLPNETDCRRGETIVSLEYHDQEWCDEHAADFIDNDTTTTLTLVPVSLKARALATPNPWDDLGPMTFRTERLETAIHEIDPRQVPMSTITGTQTMTMTESGTTTMTFATTTTSEKVVATVIEKTVETSTSTEITTTPITPSTVTSTTPITPSTVTSTTTTTSVPTGTPMTTISNLTPGMNTVQVPMPSTAPVVVISAPSDSYSSGYTTETVWSSVWEPRNTPISTVTRPVSYYVPHSNPSPTPASTGKSSGASTAQSGAGVIVMAGVGALAACFMML